MPEFNGINEKVNIIEAKGGGDGDAESAGGLAGDQTSSATITASYSPG